MIFWNSLKHYYSDGPDSDSQKHQCNESQPKHYNDEVISHLRKSKADISEQLISIETDITMLRNALHEIGQAVFEIQRKLS